MSSIGQQFIRAFSSAVIMLVRPGPDTQRAALIRPLRYDAACAA